MMKWEHSTQHPLDLKAKLAARKKFLRKHDPVVMMLGSSKVSAKTRGLPHTIKRADLPLPTHCPVLGVRLGVCGKDDNSPTIDRVDNLAGYIPGNVRVISWRANRLKSNGTLEEFEKIVTYMRNHLTNDVK